MSILNSQLFEYEAHGVKACYSMWSHKGWFKFRPWWLRKCYFSKCYFMALMVAAMRYKH